MNYLLSDWKVIFVYIYRSLNANPYALRLQVITYTILMLVFVQSLYGQSSDLPIDMYSNSRNSLKTTLTSIPLGMYRITYERALTRKWSINASLGYRPASAPMIQSFVENRVEEEEVHQFSRNLSGFELTIEPRLYLGQGYGKGFYLAPYYRYMSFDADNVFSEHEFSDENRTKETVVYSGDLSSNNVGLLFGVQFFLGSKDQMVLDFWFLGAHYGSAKGKINGDLGRQLTITEQQDIEEELMNIDVGFIEYDYVISDDNFQVNIDGPWAGFRAGLAFGIRF